MTTIDEYIATQPEGVQVLLLQVRAAIKEVAPNAKEVISYAMPTFKQHKNLIHFAAFKTHIGIYPGASGIANFEHKFGGYSYSKGALQLPVDKPLPIDLIQEITRFRVEEDAKQAALKKQKKSK